MVQENRNTLSETVSDILLDIRAVTFRFDPPYTFTSGIQSPLYLDNRLVMSYPRQRADIVSYYCTLIRQHIGVNNVDWISATATAAIPQGTLVARELNLPLVFVRPSTKKYGKENKMEGYLKKGARVVIVEDHVSTAASVLGNAATIRALGGRVRFCVATTTYETESAAQTLARARVSLHALTTGKTIVRRAEKKGFLTNSQYHEVMRWFDDPVGWGNSFATRKEKHP